MSDQRENDLNKAHGLGLDATTVTKKDMVLKLLEKHNKIDSNEMADILEDFLGEIRNTLKEGNRLEFRNFGVFEVKVQKAKIGRNPKTGEIHPIGERAAVKFKAGKILQEDMAALSGKLHKKS